MCKLHKTIFV